MNSKDDSDGQGVVATRLVSEETPMAIIHTKSSVSSPARPTAADSSNDFVQVPTAITMRDSSNAQGFEADLGSELGVVEDGVARVPGDNPGEETIPEYEEGVEVEQNFDYDNKGISIWDVENPDDDLSLADGDEYKEDMAADIAARMSLLEGGGEKSDDTSQGPTSSDLKAQDQSQAETLTSNHKRKSWTAGIFGASKKRPKETTNIEAAAPNNTEGAEDAVSAATTPLAAKDANGNSAKGGIFEELNQNEQSEPESTTAPDHKCKSWTAGIFGASKKPPKETATTDIESAVPKNTEDAGDAVFAVATPSAAKDANVDSVKGILEDLNRNEQSEPEPNTASDHKRKSWTAGIFGASKKRSKGATTTTDIEAAVPEDTEGAGDAASVATSPLAEKDANCDSAKDILEDLNKTDQDLSHEIDTLEEVPVDDKEPEKMIAEPILAVNENAKEDSDGCMQRIRDHKWPILIMILSLLLIALSTTLAMTVGNPPAPPAPTMAPTETPVLILPDYTLDTIAKNLDSPQAKAYEWSLKDQDNSPYLRSSARLLQRFAMATLYFATQGDQWAEKTGWLDMDLHECEWFTNLHQEGLSSCPAKDGVVTQLSLESNNLAASQLPPELFLLLHLTYLDLQENKIQGTIPTFVGQLQQLERLRLNRNQISGGIPLELCRQLWQLEVLSLYTNKMDQPLPEAIGQLTGLKQLWLSTNQIPGSIPSTIGLLSDLQILWLDQNQLSSSLPTEIGLLTKIEDVMIYENDLTGAIPSEISALHSTLSGLDLRSNRLSGPMPTVLGLLTTLQTLTLIDNDLTGQIPSTLGNLGSLENLYLNSNTFSSTLPSELGNLSSLRIFWAANNNSGGGLTGSVPTDFGNLLNLEDLLLQSNRLSGSVPSELGLLHAKLRTLSLEQNPGLQGQVPKELSSLTNLYEMNVESTAIRGQIPEEVCTTLDSALLFDCSETLCGCQECDCSVMK